MIGYFWIVIAGLYQIAGIFKGWQLAYTKHGWKVVWVAIVIHDGNALTQFGSKIVKVFYSRPA